MMKLQEKCKELKAQALGQPPTGSGSALSTITAGPGIKLKGALAGPPMNADEKEKMIFELTDKLT